jgi:hypothetical protein
MEEEEEEQEEQEEDAPGFSASACIWCKPFE